MRRLAVFARRPEPGRVKTRLVAALTSEPTLRLYRALVLDALAAAAAVPATRHDVWWDSDGPAVPDPDLAAALAAGGFHERAQRGGDLGERLEQAFGELLPGSDDRAVVIGADCPELDTTTIAAALDELDRADLVLGPAVDGGYYLIALRRAAPVLFHGIDWGTGRVLAQTVERADRAGLTTSLLANRHDLDTPGDLVGLIQRTLARDVRRARRGAGADPTGSPPSWLPDPPLGSHARNTLQALGLLPA